MYAPRIVDITHDVPAFDVRADHKQLALGRYDGVLALLDEATGKTQVEPLPLKPKPPELRKLLPNAGPRGETIRVVCEASGEVGMIVASIPGVQAERVPRQGVKPGTVAFDVTHFGPREVAGVPVTVDRPAPSFTSPFNLTGSPAASIPVGWTDDGLPIGMQIVGNHLADHLVLRASRAFELAAPWADRWPSL